MVNLMANNHLDVLLHCLWTLYLHLFWFLALCCQPPRSTATAPSAPGTPHATQPAPSATSTYGGCSISSKWTLNSPCGRCFTCSRRHRECTATSTTGSKPRTSGPEMILPFWSSLASGFVVNLYFLYHINNGVCNGWSVHSVWCWCSVHNRFWSCVGHGSSGYLETSAVGGFCRLHRSRSAHINPYVVSLRFYLIINHLTIKSSLIFFYSFLLSGLSVTDTCWNIPAETLTWSGVTPSTFTSTPSTHF